MTLKVGSRLVELRQHYVQVMHIDTNTEDTSPRLPRPWPEPKWSPSQPQAVMTAQASNLKSLSC